MTPADEACFITLWQQELTCPEIAQRLDIPPVTARSRAYTLQQQGKIQPRPRGGARQRGTSNGNRQKSQAAVGDGTPPASHPRAPAITFMAVPEVHELIHTVKDLVARVATLEEARVPLPRVPPRTRDITRGHPHPWDH
jgi:hypothetical protein